ncbi:MAG TPA: hypothetical protein VHZ03_23815 [Trebonia sp.]|jgi:hypothetical protein|nr:hypothetical protein [Trebonia sp.]
MSILLPPQSPASGTNADIIVTPAQFLVDTRGVTGQAIRWYGTD